MFKNLNCCSGFINSNNLLIFKFRKMHNLKFLCIKMEELALILYTKIVREFPPNFMRIMLFTTNWNKFCQKIKYNGGSNNYKIFLFRFNMHVFFYFIGDFRYNIQVYRFFSSSIYLFFVVFLPDENLFSHTVCVVTAAVKVSSWEHIGRFGTGHAVECFLLRHTELL